MKNPSLDIIQVVAQGLTELNQAEAGLQNYVHQFLDEQLNSSEFDEGITASLPPGTGRAGVDRIRRIVKDIVVRKN